MSATASRAVISFVGHDGEKLASRDPTCPDLALVTLRDDRYPHLQLDGIEVERRDIVSTAAALAVLRHFLTTGRPVDLVPWPPDDWEDRLPSPPDDRPPGDEEVAF